MEKIETVFVNDFNYLEKYGKYFLWKKRNRRNPSARFCNFTIYVLK